MGSEGRGWSKLQRQPLQISKEWKPRMKGIMTMRCKKSLQNSCGRFSLLPYIVAWYRAAWYLLPVTPCPPMLLISSFVIFSCNTNIDQTFALHLWFERRSHILSECYCECHSRTLLASIYGICCWCGSRENRPQEEL